MTVEERLRELFPTAKKTTLKQMVQTGRVRMGTAGGPATRRLADEIPAGQDVHVLSQAPEPPRHRRGDLEVVFEDEDVLVVSKPPGLLTATVPQEPRPTLLAKVRDYLGRTAPRSRVGLIHRLDKDARGLLVFSKNEGAYHSLKEQLKEREVGREYHAVVVGVPKPANSTIQNRLMEETDGKVHSTTERNKGEVATTHYETVRWMKGVAGRTDAALLKVTLETGRKHQIRVHLAEKGHPIFGDVMYGKAIHWTPPLMLSATRLAFRHPRNGQMVQFELPIPVEFMKLVDGNDDKMSL